jgi:hypothetical protein
MVSFLPKLSSTKQGSDNDNESRILVWGSISMDMGELHESLGGTTARAKHPRHSYPKTLKLEIYLFLDF